MKLCRNKKKFKEYIDNDCKLAQKKINYYVWIEGKGDALHLEHTDQLNAVSFGWLVCFPAYQPQWAI